MNFSDLLGPEFELREPEVKPRRQGREVKPRRQGREVKPEAVIQESFPGFGNQKGQFNLLDGEGF